MMEEYRKDIENIHASEELIQRTIKRAKQEEKKQKKSGAKIIRFGGAAVAAAAAAMIIINVGVMNRSDFIINEIDGIETNEVVRSGLFMQTDEESEDMTEDEFNEYIGFDCEKLFESLDFEKANIVDETGTFFYESEDADVSVKISKTENVIPENIDDLKASKVEGKEVRLAKDENKYYAAGNEGNVDYFITVKCSDDKQFRELIKEFQKNF